MREIKFRAWDGSKIQTEFCIDSSDGMIFTEHDNGGDIAGCCGEYKEWAEYHDDWKLMQYTGLKDRHGKEIYEGDIVNHTFQFTANQTTGVVAWNIEGLGWYIERCSAGSYPLSNVVNIEVIGNIYEHPELLER